MLQRWLITLMAGSVDEGTIEQIMNFIDEVSNDVGPAL